DFAALPGLLIGSVAAAGVTVLLMRRSILTEKLARRGRHVTREYGVNPLHVLRVEDVMEPPVAPPAAGVAPVVTYPDELLETAMRKLLEHEVDILPVDAKHHRGHAEQLEGRVVLLGLRDRRAAVELARHQQGGRRHAPRVHQGRVRQPVVRLVPERLAEEAEREQRNIRLARHADPVYD